MNHITILEKSRSEWLKENLSIVLMVEKYFVEDSYDWLKLVIKDKFLLGYGTLKVQECEFEIILKYSPIMEHRPERIYVQNPKLPYCNAIHIYNDKSLCLYHPIIDNPKRGIISLKKIIPWISEWCIHFLEWKKYGVWIGKEIAH